MTSPERKPYHGLFRKLVIAFDVGTTFSGASFAILDPNEVPKIQGVTRYVPIGRSDRCMYLSQLNARFPAQAKTGGDCKIPSILYYDQEGSVRAVGAEALDEAFLEQAEDENFIRVEWQVPVDFDYLLLINFHYKVQTALASQRHEYFRCTRLRLASYSTKQDAA